MHLMDPNWITKTIYCSKTNNKSLQSGVAIMHKNYSILQITTVIKTLMSWKLLASEMIAKNDKQEKYLPIFH